MRRPSTSTVIACLALSVAVVGAAPSAQAVVKRIVADDSKRLQGKTLAQVRSQINASKLSGHTYSQVRSSINASKLSGKSLSQVRSGIDASTVGGRSASQFVNGSGTVYTGRLTESQNSGNANVVVADGSLSLEASCGAGNLRIFARNRSADAAQMSVEYNDGTAQSAAFNAAVASNSGLYVGFDKAASTGTVRLGYSANGHDFVAVGQISAVATGLGCQADGQILVSETS